MPLVLDAAMNSVFSFTGSDFAQFANAESALVHHLPVVEERHRDARHSEYLHGRPHEVLQLLDPPLVQGVGLSAGEGLALVSLRAQALGDEVDRRTSLFDARFAAVDNEDSPHGADAMRDRCHHGAFIGRGLIIKVLALIPTVAWPAAAWMSLMGRVDPGLYTVHASATAAFASAGLRIEDGNVCVHLRRG